MTLLTFVLLLLGIFFLFMGWRWQNPPNDDVMTALKGLVHLKRELSEVRESIHYLEQKAEESEKLKIHITQAYKNDLVYKQNMEIAASLQDLKISADKQEPTEKTDTQTISRNFRAKLDSSLDSSKEIERPLPALPDRYRQALELAEFGLSVQEIAHRMSLSQDAVNLILRTHQWGGEI